VEEEEAPSEEEEDHLKSFHQPGMFLLLTLDI
jgi:hypothetical protein